VSTFLEGLTQEQRDGIMVGLCYERVRREYQGGYRLWPVLGPEILEGASFKTAMTVAAWCQRLRWNLTWREVRWQGYIKSAFRQLAPTIPHLGQLKNRRLVRTYVAAAPKWKPPSRTSAQLDALYRRVLHPSLASTEAMALLGLRPPAQPD
jgi:hypothetical protein